MSEASASLPADSAGGDSVILPSEEDVEEFWSQIVAKTSLKGRLPVLITGSNNFTFALEEGRYLKPLVEQTACSLVTNERICESVLLVGSSAHGGDSHDVGSAWDNIMQETMFERAAKGGALPMVMLKFKQSEAQPNPKDFVTVEAGSPIVATIQLPSSGDKYLMSQGWKATAVPAALSFGGGPRAVQLISRRGAEGVLAQELKQLAIPVPAAGGFGAELALGKGPAPWPEHFRPEAVPEALWDELKSVAEGDVEGKALEAYAGQVVEALHAVVRFGLRQERPMLAQVASDLLNASAAPSDSAPSGFPESLGPFDLAPTSFDPARFHLPKTHGPPSSWTLSPGSLTVNERRALRIKAARITGQLSPQMQVTLSKEDRAAANIPQDAAFFSWSYPIEQEMPVPPSEISAEFAFLFFGGYMYFNKAQAVMCTLALTPGSDAGGSSGLRFGDPIPFPAEKSMKVARDRFKPVTIPALRETGVCYFCWMKPGELQGAEHGAFAYLFHRRDRLDRVPEDLLARDVFFPVLGKPTKASQRASTSLGAHFGVSTKSRTPSPRPPAQPPTRHRPNMFSPPARTSPARKTPEVPPAPWDSQVAISVVTDVDPSVQGEGRVLVSVEPPAGATSQCTSLCCVIDVSGSMGKEAVIQGASGVGESTGLSLLDIAKHGIRTLIHTLGDQDRLSVVSFNNAASTIVSPIKMDAAGKKSAEEKLERLEARGGTNLWAGLETGLELLRQFQDGGCFSHVMLLTDGESQRRDEIGPNFTKWCHRWPLCVPCTVNTFGFGYNLDSALLVELASMGHGSYSFIPDAGFVGTVFVNTVGNLLVTMGANASLELQPGSSAEVLEVYGGYAFDRTAAEPRKWLVNIGNLQLGQSRSIVLRMKFTGAATSQPYLTVRGKFELGNNLRSRTRSRFYAMVEWLPDATATFHGLPAAIDSIEQNFWRLSFVTALSSAINQANRGQRETAQDTIQKVREGIEASSAAKSEVLVALLEDVTGQTGEALSRADWWTKWGKHFLPSLKFAHLCQQCNNFKDPGVQVYGGTLFETIRDQADDVFNELPPPKPTARRTPMPSSYGAPAPQRAAPPVSMACYNDRYGG